MSPKVVILAFALAAFTSAAYESTPPTLPIEGIWISDRDRTLDGLRTAQPWSESQWRTLSDPTLFGHLVQVIRDNTAVSAFEGRCDAAEAFVVVESSPAAVVVRMVAPREGEPQVIRFEIDGDTFRIPIGAPDKGLHEVFRRASAAEARREHPCLAQILGAGK